MAEQPAGQAQGDGAPAKAGPKGVVLIGALVGSLLIGGAAGVFAVGPMIAKKSGYDPALASRAGAAGGDSAGGEHAGATDGDAAGSKAGSEGGAPANLHLIDNLVLNPAGSGGARFLMLAAAIELADAPLVEEVKARDAEVRDIVLRVMGSKTVDELAEATNRETLKRELADSLGTLFKKKQAVRRVFFPQFVIQ